MIEARKLKQDLEQDPKYAYAAYMTVFEVVRQGFSEFTLEEEYDVIRLHEILDDLGYDVQCDIDNLKMRVVPRETL